MSTKKGAPLWGRLFFILSWLVLSAPVSASDQPAKSEQRQNIIVVMADDHAQWALGAYGLDQIETPNIDWLAEQGILFENAMSSAPVCSPSRASFYTGKLPSQHGVHDFLSENADFDANWLDGEKLLSERLVEEGYRTALFGKWHATTNSKIPQPGFDRWLSYDPYKAGWEAQYNHTGPVSFSSDGEELDFRGTQSWFLTTEAIRFIDKPSPKPFFISLNFTEPHFPFKGLPERLADRYRAVANEIVKAGGSSDILSRGPHTRTPDDHIEQLAQYLAAVNLIDDQVGRLLDALQGRGLLDETLVVYTSDHGLLVGQYGLYGKTNATNIPNFYEETIRIPLIVFGPDKSIRGMQSRSEFVDLLDLHVTIMDYATAGRISHSTYGPGDSLRPLLNGERETNWRSVQNAERGNARMIIDGRWKLVRIYQQDANKLPVDNWYDLSHPLGERHSIDWVPEQVRDRLTTQLESFFKKYETPEHTGRRIWEQPPPNQRMVDDFVCGFMGCTDPNR